MNKNRRTANLSNVITFDASGNMILPESMSLTAAPHSSDDSLKVPSTAWVRAHIIGLSYATQSYVTTQITNLIGAAPAALDTLNELAAALGNDASFSTTVTTSIASKVPQTRTITINGTAYDLSADRSWTIAGGVTSFNTRTGAITLTSADVTGVLGFTPYNATNPSGYITSTGTAAAVNQTVGGGSEANLVYSQVADNDFFRIRVGGGSNAGWVEIATADDGTEPIYLRQYTGVFSSVTRTATLLDGSGNTYFPGTVHSAGSAVITTANIGSQSVNYANSAGSAGSVTNGVYTNTDNVLAGGNKIVIQNSTDGGTSRGIFMWNSGDPNWGIYMATAGAGKTLGGTTAPAGLDGRTDHAIRFRVANSTSQIGFLWENNDNVALMQLQPNTGTLLVKNRIVLGVFPNSTTNSGEAWIGRAADRNQGTMTVQLGGGSATSRSFEVVDYLWSVVLFSVGSNGNCVASGDITAYSDRRIKTNIVSINSALSKVLSLKGVYYNRTDNGDTARKIGFIAQDVQTVVPELVTYDKVQDRYSVSYANSTALLVEAIKEQQTQIEELKTLVHALTIIR